MRPFDSISIAAEGLKANPFRSFLTSLGVIIGVAAVIIMVGIGEGARVSITSGIQSLGSNLLIVTPGRAIMGIGTRGAAGSATTLNLKVYEKLKDQVTLAGPMAPESSRNFAVTVGTNSLTTSVVGTTPALFQIRNYIAESGRLFEDTEVSGVQRVAVLGKSVAEELFGSEDPIGSAVRIRTTQFRVIGVLESKGQSGMINLDDQIFVPITTAQRRLIGNSNIRNIYVFVPNPRNMSAAHAEVEAILLEELKDANRFNVRNQAEILATFDATVRSFTMLLAGIAAVSLLVGGIGIMNIMLVSVTERTREIGIRKAVGATRVDILLQFLLEATALSLSGGIIGIMAGAAGARLASRFAGWPAVISPTAVVLATSFSIAIGLFFGVFPANKASLLEPVEALRYD